MVALRHTMKNIISKYRINYRFRTAQDEKVVQVITSEGQEYRLSRNLFTGKWDVVAIDLDAMRQEWDWAGTPKAFAMSKEESILRRASEHSPS